MIAMYKNLLEFYLITVITNELMKGRREFGQRPDSVIIHNRDEQLFVFLPFLVVIDNAVFTTIKVKEIIELKKSKDHLLFLYRLEDLYYAPF